MFGIQGRLTLLFVVIVTLVLGISGTYAQYSLGHELEVSSQRLRQGVLTRLQTSLPSALWDLDKAKVDNIVAAEMMPPGAGLDPRLRHFGRPVLRQAAQ
jgi:hypothetical protein